MIELLAASPPFLTGKQVEAPYRSFPTHRFLTIDVLLRESLCAIFTQ